MMGAVLYNGWCWNAANIKYTPHRAGIDHVLSLRLHTDKHTLNASSLGRMGLFRIVTAGVNGKRFISRHELFLTRVGVIRLIAPSRHFKGCKMAGSKRAQNGRIFLPVWRSKGNRITCHLQVAADRQPFAFFRFRKAYTHYFHNTHTPKVSGIHTAHTHWRPEKSSSAQFHATSKKCARLFS